MSRKRWLSFMLALPITLVFAGCGDTTHCTLTIHAAYGGYGIAGQDLGHGEKVNYYEVYVGYKIYEDTLQWIVGNVESDRLYVVAEITEITPDGVTLEFSDNEREYIGLDDKYVTLKYGEEMSEGLESGADDGMNYDYTISFSDYSE